MDAESSEVGQFVKQPLGDSVAKSIPFVKKGGKNGERGRNIHAIVELPRGSVHGKGQPLLGCVKGLNAENGFAVARTKADWGHERRTRRPDVLLKANAAPPQERRMRVRSQAVNGPMRIQWGADVSTTKGRTQNQSRSRALSMALW